jgi:uncharacterized protein with ParB-like and HNH nuclease domain
MSANNLSELFNQRIFRIPDYQRGYAWIDKQLSALWDDLDEIAEIDGELKRHYTGTIYLEETQPLADEKWLSGVKFYNVVDGQQRLTTISILLFELLKVADTGYCEESKNDLMKTFLAKSNSTGESKVYKFSYAVTDKNYNFLQHTIFEDDKVVLQPNYLNHYTNNLSEAKKFFSTKISFLSNEQREKLFKKLTTSLQFDIRTIEKDLDVQAVFETMNNRGKPLSTLEKLKNRLIYLTEKLTVESEDKNSLRKKINEAWGKVYTSLAQNPNQILDEDTFLSAHLSLYRKPKESTFSEKIAEEKVFEMFCNKSEKYDLEENGTAKEEPVTYKKIEDYILKLSELAPLWYEIHNSKSKLIKKILVLNGSKEIKIFLVAVLNKTKDESLIEKIFTNLEKIFFKNGVPGINVMDERTAAAWARNIYVSEDDLEGIIKKTEDLINIAVNVPNIIHSFKYLFTYERGAKGFHRWGNLKYFLFEYEDFLKLKAQETNDKVTLDDFDKTTIEHIIPQHFRENWKEEVDSVTNGLEEEEKIEQTRKVLLNTLGNLTILKNGKNSSLGNKGWKEKRERFRTGSYNEIEISKHDQWTKLNISERGVEMLKFLETKVTGLTFTEDEIKKTLHFDDYIIERFEEKLLPPTSDFVQVE